MYCGTPQTSQRKKERNKNLADLEEKLKVLEREHVEGKDPHILKQIKVVRKDINEIYEVDLEKKAKFAKQRFYENGPRALKLLAWRLRKQQAESAIFEIRDPKTKKVCHKLEDMQRIFENYYRVLYRESNTNSPKEINTFLDSLDLPSIGEIQNEALTAEITKEEIGKAISRLKANKAPGMDGIPPEVCLKFWNLLGPHLLNMYLYSI